MKSNHELVAISGSLSDAQVVVEDQSMTPAEAYAKAIEYAYDDMGVAVDVELSKINGIDEHSSEFSSLSVRSKTSDYRVGVRWMPRAKSIWYPLDGELIPATMVEINAVDQRDKQRQAYAYVISDRDLKDQSTRVLSRANLISNADFTYRTFTDAQTGDPTSGPFRGPVPHAYPIVGLTPAEANEAHPLTAVPGAQPSFTLAHGPISTSDNWLTDEDAVRNGTDGNNVWTFYETPDFVSQSARLTGDRSFDWEYDYQNPRSESSRNAAKVNAFYLANWLHDYFYDVGFDEVSGTGQRSNYGRGGREGDSLEISVQADFIYNNAMTEVSSDGGFAYVAMGFFVPPTPSVKTFIRE